MSFKYQMPFTQSQSFKLLPALDQPLILKTARAVISKRLIFRSTFSKLQKIWVTGDFKVIRTICGRNGHPSIRKVSSFYLS